MRVGFSLCGMAAILAAAAVPGLAQTEGGRTSSFTLQQGIETQRNPQEDPDRENDTRLISNTDLTYAVSSVTRRAALELTLGVRLRGAAGDLDVGDEEGFEIDRPRLALRHSYTAPGATFDTSASVERANIQFLRRVELIEGEDGTLEVPEDIDDLRGNGFRTNTRLSFAAQFGENRPFGWGVSVSNSTLTYQETDNAALEDSSDTTTGLNARFDLMPVLSLTTGLRYNLRSSPSESAESTLDYDLVLTHRRSDESSLRTGVSLAQPEGRQSRLTLFFGGTQEIDGKRSLDFNLGTTIAEEGERRLVSVINYREALSRTLDISAGLDRRASDTSDNETVLDTAASLQLSKTLSPRSGMTFGLIYGARENFNTEQTSADATVSVQYTHDLTRDWAVSVGGSYTWRDESDVGETTSDRLFFNIGRSWGGRF